MVTIESVSPRTIYRAGKYILVAVQHHSSVDRHASLRVPEMVVWATNNQGANTA
jgi:hypothetical protein